MTISEHLTSRLPADFEWGEPGDILWEARDAGWADAVALAYERGAQDQADIREAGEALSEGSRPLAELEKLGLQ